MMKIEALFCVPADKKLFLSQIRKEIIPLLYQMPYIEKIELTPFHHTPVELQEQFTDQPIYFQLAVYANNVDDLIKTFETQKGKNFADYLIHTFEDKIITAVGEAKVFYKSDLEHIQRKQLFPHRNS